MSKREPKAFADVVVGDNVWVELEIPKSNLVPPVKKPTRNSTRDKCLFVVFSVSETRCSPFFYGRINRGLPVWKYLVVLKRDETTLTGVIRTTFDGSTELSLEKVTKLEDWYPVAPATGDYPALPATDGKPVWLSLTKVYAVTEPDPASCAILSQYLD